MIDDNDHVKRVRAEYQKQQRRIEQDRRLVELINKFSANPFKLGILIIFVLVLMLMVVK